MEASFLSDHVKTFSISLSTLLTPDPHAEGSHEFKCFGFTYEDKKETWIPREDPASCYGFQDTEVECNRLGKFK